VDWFKIVQTAWPILVVILSLASFAVLLWLRSQFPTKVDLKAAEEGILARIDAHQGRLDQGSEKIAGLDKRLAVIEDDCESAPSKADLNQGLSVVAGRVSGLEASVRGVEKQVGTGNRLLELLLEQGLKTGTKA
jgi:hypothetical protein